ncbi:neutral zinc metallopeptidase [Acrocarpospora phusangensis]|nr:neutral zinc metallopeptidase [Acrocarpospora phusangensis]
MVVAVVAACVMVAGSSCGVVSVSSGPTESVAEPTAGDVIDSQSGPADEGGVESTNGPGQASGCNEDGQTFASDVRLARCLAEAFWTQRFQASGASYRPVTEFVAYTGFDGPACGGEPSVPNNAFYCSDGHFIAFDANWLEGLYQQLGDAAVYVVIPHEFGHAVQAQLVQNFNFSVERELQADCYAGGTLSALIQAGQLQAEDGDDVEVMNNLIAAGDPTDAWWEPGAHGTPERRQAAFVTGYQQGVGAC